MPHIQPGRRALPPVQRHGHDHRPGLGRQERVSATRVADGVYTFKVDATDIAGNAADQQTASVIVDDTYPPRGLRGSNPYFSPNDDGEKDDTILPLVASDANGFASWSLNVRNWNDIVVRSTSGLGAPPAAFTWDGYDDGNGLVLSGTYGYSLTVTDPSDNETTSAPRYLVVDSGGPTADNPTASYAVFSPRGTRADDSLAAGNGYPGTSLGPSPSTRSPPSTGT